MQFNPLRDASASGAEIAQAAGCEWRTAKKYLEQESCQPPVYGPRQSPGRIIDPFTDVIDAWLRADPHLKASVIHERLAADPYVFAGHYQRVKVYVRERRPQILTELGHDDADEHGGFYARFAVTPGTQAQVDWGDEGTITTPEGDVSVQSFHMVLSYSRDYQAPRCFPRNSASSMAYSWTASVNRAISSCSSRSCCSWIILAAPSGLGRLECGQRTVSEPVKLFETARRRV